MKQAPPRERARRHSFVMTSSCPYQVSIRLPSARPARRRAAFDSRPWTIQCALPPIDHVVDAEEGAKRVAFRARRATARAPGSARRALPRRRSPRAPAEAELHLPFQPHAAELRRRPCDVGRRRRGSCRRPWPWRRAIGLAQHEREKRTEMFAPARRCARHGAPAPSSRHPGRPWMPAVAQRQQRIPKASQSRMKRLILSASSAPIAPAWTIGLLANRPTGRPSMRMSAVTAPAPNCGRSSSTEPVSASSPITRRTS